MKEERRSFRLIRRGLGLGEVGWSSDGVSRLAMVRDVDGEIAFMST